MGVRGWSASSIGLVIHEAATCATVCGCLSIHLPSHEETPTVDATWKIHIDDRVAPQPSNDNKAPSTRTRRLGTRFSGLHREMNDVTDTGTDEDSCLLHT